MMITSKLQKKNYKHRFFFSNHFCQQQCGRKHSQRRHWQHTRFFMPASFSTKVKQTVKPLNHAMHLHVKNEPLQQLHTSYCIQCILHNTQRCVWFFFYVFFRVSLRDDSKVELKISLWLVCSTIYRNITISKYNCCASSCYCCRRSTSRLELASIKHYHCI